MGRRIGARHHDLQHPAAELTVDFLGRLAAAWLIFEGVVQQGRDGLVFVSSGLQHQGCHAQEMRQIRNTRSLPDLGGMDSRRVCERVLKTTREKREVSDLFAEHVRKILVRSIVGQSEGQKENRITPAPRSPEIHFPRQRIVVPGDEFSQVGPDLIRSLEPRGYRRFLPQLGRRIGSFGEVLEVTIETQSE